MGFKINGKVAWIVQELPAFLLPVICFIYRVQLREEVHLLDDQGMVLFILFVGHYFNRAIVFPLRLVGGKDTPALVCFLAFLFCTLNGTMQGLSIITGGRHRGTVTAPHFIAGLALFFFGFGVNCHADSVLRNLRRPGESGYKIPYGGAYRLVSAANYSGEIIEWAGFALASWSLPGYAFSFFTFCNIAPRGSSHHDWYHSKFEDYPHERWAVLPYLW